MSKNKNEHNLYGVGKSLLASYIDMGEKIATATATTQSKNERGKARPVNQPYEVWDNGEEIFQVLKCYQAPHNEASNEYARRLVAYSGSGEVDEAGHDMYLSDLRRRAVMVWQEGNSNLNGKDTTMPTQYTISR